MKYTDFCSNVHACTSMCKPCKTGKYKASIADLKRNTLLLVVLGALGVIVMAQTYSGFSQPQLSEPYRLRVPCNESFPSTVEENIRVVMTYPTAGARPYLEKLGFFKPYVHPVRRIPVIATASSANHFYESLVLMENIVETLFPAYPDLEIHYYDIGLWASHVERIKQFPRTFLHRFPFEDFPDHVSNLMGYAWKPIIMQMALQEHGFVLWADASIRFQNSNLDRLFTNARTQGITFRKGFSSVTAHTDPETFKFLGERACLFDKFNEIEANFILVYNSDVIHEYVMKPFVACALLLGCMVTKHSSEMLKCRGPEHRGMCHRFDQSVLTIILTRLFSRNLESLHVLPESGVIIKRSFTIPFLPEFINRILIRMIAYFL